MQMGLTASAGLWGCAAMVFGIVAAGSADAGDPVRLTLHAHRFSPAAITVPAGQRFRIEVTNQDATPAEFESSDLRVEKIVTAGSTIAVMAGPLRPGTYAFVDDYNPAEARGTVTAASAGQ